MKVILALVVVAVVAGLGVSWAKGKADSVIHHAIDTGLPAKVGAHPWAPVGHGKAVRAERVLFSGGTLTTVRCHAALGTYTVHIDHGFAFQETTTPIKAGCPGRQLRQALSHATRVSVDGQGQIDTLTFTNTKGHTIATLQGRHR